jgi:molecular chaperone IbpA
MRTNLNFSPLFRSTIGFDRVFDLLENASRTQSFESWPPYDIVRTSEDSYRITMAVAGFSDAELSITHQPNLLIVADSKPEEEGEYLHRGIPATSFERRFELADHVKVANANLQNGLLTITLVREVPEEMKPRKISIKTAEAAGESKRIEGSKQAA